MSVRDRLVAFVKEKMEESGREWKGEFTDDTPLLKSGLFDSLNLLELASCIEAEIDSQIDVVSIDLVEEWDTITDILRFIEEYRGNNRG